MCKPAKGIMQYISARDERINSSETAYYVLKYFEKDFLAVWKSPKTQKQCGNYLEELILPRMMRDPLKEYDMERIFAILDELRDVPMIKYVNDVERQTYDESTVEKFRTIIKHIFRVAALHGICDDLEWTPPEPPKEKSFAEKKTEERTKLPKSLRIAVEKAVANMLLDDHLMAGVRMALLLMFAFGLRNSEARGAVYGNIKCIGGYWFLATHSTPDDTATITITIGGKTYNMYRLLPIPELVLPILLARRAYLEAEVAAGRIALDPARGIRSVDDFPIANCEDDWTRPCSAARLTRAGRAFLAEAKIEGELMTTLAEDMVENYSEIVYGEEKDLTAYLLRRTYGEHLRECGCDKAQRERCMGHVQTDESKKNNDFVNENDLKDLAEILSRRPLLNRIADVPVIDVSSATADVVLEDVNEVVLDFLRMSQDAEYCIRLASNEYHVPPEVTLMPQKGKSTDVPYSVEFETHHRPTTNRERKGPPADVNVVYDYQKSYAPKKQKKNKK